MSEARPTVSIVLPVYNGERYLEQSLAGCIEQTFPSWELIVVNDCSTDSSPRIARRFAARDSRIAVIDNEANRQLPGALNVGFDRAQGRYWTWTSDDNSFRPTALERMVAVLEQEPGVGMVYADSTRISDSGEPIGRLKTAPPEFLIGENCVGACFLYRADVARRAGGYAQDLFLSEDYEYWLRLSTLAPLKHLPEDLYLYRSHEGSLTAKRQYDIRAMDAVVKERYLARCAGAATDSLVRAHVSIACYGRTPGIRAKHAFAALRYGPGAFRLVAHKAKRWLKKRGWSSSWYG